MSIRPDAVPVGSILAYAVDDLDSGLSSLWRFCRGDKLSKVDFPELFEMIKYSNGADDEDPNLFHLPDLQGYFLRGVGETSLTTGPAPAVVLPGSIQDYATAAPVNLKVQPSLPKSKIRAIDPKNKAAENTNLPATNMVNYDDTSKQESVPINIAMNFIIKVTPSPIIPIASIVPYAGMERDVPDMPADLRLWAVCEGQEIETASMRYLNLLTVISARYGHNASRFNLPDLRGRFIRGVDLNKDVNIRHDKNQRVAPPGLTADKVDVAGSTQSFATGQPNDPLTVTKLHFPPATTSDTLHDPNGISCLRMDNTAPSKSLEDSDKETRPVNVNVQFLISLAEQYFDSDIMPVGAIIAIPGQGTPDDKYWKKCDGTSFLKRELLQLSAVCCTAWGSVDEHHFNLPDLQGQFLRGVDSSGTGRDPDRLLRNPLKTGGSSQGVGSFQGHATHININIPNSQLEVQVEADNTKTGFDLSAVNTDELGGWDKETRPINVAVQYYIKCATVSGIL
jgi:microcystin-dependent protein